MQILKICYEYPPIGGGGGKVAAALSHELVKKGHQVDFFTMKYRELPRIENHQGVTVHRIPALRFDNVICRPPEMITYILMAYPRILRFVRSKKIDINHTHFIFPDGVIALWLKRNTGLPYIVTAHGSDVPGYNPDRFLLLHQLLKPLWKQVVEQADEIVSPSNHLANLIHQHAPQKNVEIIPNGLEPNTWNLEKRTDARILIISRMFERKGIQYFLRALDGIEEPYQIDIVGDGPYLSVLKDIAQEITTAAQIRFHGWLDNQSVAFRKLLEQANIFVFPSEAENFPTVLLEAMAAGLAIITTNKTGCEEVVGEAALLVNARDSSGLRQALQILVSQPDLRARLGKLGRERLIKLFGWSLIADRYIHVYQKSIAMFGQTYSKTV